MSRPNLYGSETQLNMESGEDEDMRDAGLSHASESAVSALQSVEPQAGYEHISSNLIDRQTEYATFLSSLEITDAKRINELFHEAVVWLRSQSENKHVLHALREDSSTYADICSGMEKLHKLIDRYHENELLTQDSVYIHLQHISFHASCLNGILAIVRKPFVYDKFIDRGRVADIYVETHDFTRTREMFPNADTPLLCRLSNGISRRRRRLKERICASNPTSAKVKKEQDESEDSRWTTDASTNASEPGTELQPYGLTITLGPTFDCATCFRQVQTANERDYNQHIDHDLKPYLCTYVDCVTPMRTYGTQAEWFEHEKACRRQYWECQAFQEPGLVFDGCSDDSDEPFSCSSETEFQVHVLQQHPHQWDQIEEATARCKIDDRELKMSPDCRLCGFKAGDLARLKPHLGAHMRELALFSLPEAF